MRFGVALPRYEVDFETVKQVALWAEGAGFDSLWVTDHLQPTRGRTLLEPWTILSSLAPLTQRVRLGTSVLCFSYRHPAVLAKMVSTLDRVSGGRVELGLGAGSKPQAEEHKAMGIPYPRFSERVARLKDYVRVLRILWRGNGRASFDSPYYPLVNATLDSPTVQERVPIWIGARGEKMLKIAAEIGEGWNFYGDSVDEYRRAVELFEERLRELGRPVRSVRRAVFTTLAIWRGGERPGRERIEELKRRHTIVYGTPREVINKIESLKEMKVELIIMRDLTPNLSGLKLFESEVMSSF